MAHVDALSRSVAYVNELPLERELEYRQLADPQILKISRGLEFNDSDKLKLINGLVYKITEGREKFVVLHTMIHSVLRAYHDDMAHCDLQKTIESISQNYWFPTMRRRIKEYIENCFTCLISNSSTNSFERETQLYPLPTMPQEILHLDHFGPLQETTDNFKHIFIIVIDAFTRFT